MSADYKEFKPLFALNCLTGSAGPAGEMGSWALDEEADLALFSDMGQPVARKGLKSLPPRLQASWQPGISREGSTSLPAHLHRSALGPASESAAPSPAPGVRCCCHSLLRDVQRRSEVLLLPLSAFPPQVERGCTCSPLKAAF